MFPPSNIEGTKKANPKILDEICTPQEMSGLLNWALQGLYRLLEQEKFSEAKTWDQQREDYIRASNSAKAYIEAELEVTKNHEDIILYDELYSKYCVWCKNENLPSVTKSEFTKNMNQFLPEAKMTTVSVKKKTVRAWRFVRFCQKLSDFSDLSTYIPLSKNKENIKNSINRKHPDNSLKSIKKDQIESYFDESSEGAKSAAERLKRLRELEKDGG